MTSQTEIKSPPIVAIVNKAGFTGYTKVHHSMVVHSDETGVCLRPEAFKAVADVYPDFAYSLAGAPKRRRRRYPENRKKQHALRVRLDDTMYATVRRWMQEDGHETAQDFLSKCILAYGEINGKDFM